MSLLDLPVMWPCLSLSQKMSENIRSTLLNTSFLQVLTSVCLLLCKTEMVLKPAPYSGGKDWLPHTVCPWSTESIMELSDDTPQAHLTGESIHKVDIAKVLSCRFQILTVKSESLNRQAYRLLLFMWLFFWEINKDINTLLYPDHLPA